MSCPHAERCHLYHHSQDQDFFKVWRIFYCDSRAETCARYVLLAKGREPPSALMPDGALVEQAATGQPRS